MMLPQFFSMFNAHRAESWLSFSYHTMGLSFS